MKVKRVNRYYCEHCSKGSCGKPSMRKHEERCIKNPNRVCGFCLHRADQGIVQKPMAELIKAIFDDEGELGKIKELTDNCPGCIIAAIVQSKVQQPPDSNGFWIDYSYKEEAKKFWDEQNKPSEELCF